MSVLTDHQRPFQPIRCVFFLIRRAEVFLVGTGSPVHQRESLTPTFTIEGLAPGVDYTVTVTAVNRKGSSPPVSLQAYTLKVAENRMSE